MSPSRRILNPYLELPQPFRIPLQHPRQPQLFQLLLQPRRQPGIHRRPPREDDGFVQAAPHVDVGGLDGVEEELGDAGLFDVDEVWLEEAFRGLEAFAPHADDAAVGEGVGFDEHGGVFRQPLVEVQVVGDVAEFLFDLAHGFEVGGAVEGVPAAEEQGDQVAGYVAAGDVQAAGEVVEHGGFVDGDDVRDAVAGVDDHAGGEALRVEGEDGLDGDVDAAELVLFEHFLAHEFAVLQRVHGGFGEEDFAALGIDLQFFVECVVP